MWFTPQIDSIETSLRKICASRENRLSFSISTHRHRTQIDSFKCDLLHKSTLLKQLLQCELWRKFCYPHLQREPFNIFKLDTNNTHHLSCRTKQGCASFPVCQAPHSPVHLLNEQTWPKRSHMAHRKIDFENQSWPFYSNHMCRSRRRSHRQCLRPSRRRSRPHNPRRSQLCSPRRYRRYSPLRCLHYNRLRWVVVFEWTGGRMGQWEHLNEQ